MAMARESQITRPDANGPMAATSGRPPLVADGGDPFAVNYYDGADYLRIDTKSGVSHNRGGTRILTLTEDFLFGLHSGLVSECGDAADTVLKTCGRNWGRIMAALVDRELSGFYGRPLSEFPVGVFQSCLVAGMGRHGWGRLVLDFTAYEQGIISATVHDPPFAALLKTAERPCEGLLAGVLAGMFSHFANQDLDCRQTECVACGAPTARFVVALASRLAKADDWLNPGLGHDKVVAKLSQVTA